jgi:hypothetical protein
MSYAQVVLLIILLQGNAALQKPLASNTSCAKSLTQAYTVKSFPLDVWALTVTFERALDLDHDEHAYFEAEFVFENKSTTTVEEVYGNAVLSIGGVKQSILGDLPTRLEPGEMRDITISFPQRGTDTEITRTPLSQVNAHWQSTSIRLCDGETLK